MTIFRKFTFDAAHFLPNVPEGHKCRNIHGHTYLLTLYISGTPDAVLGWVVDFGEVKAKMNPILEVVDHKLLNNVTGLENPTCERLSVWLWERIKGEIPQLERVELYETPSSGAVYCGI